jgi:hypothetical protein
MVFLRTPSQLARHRRMSATGDTSVATMVRMQDRLRAWPGVVFVLATLLGVLLRAVYVGWSTGVPFDHLLHAHSHSLYFGWAGLVILTAATYGHTTARRWAWASLALNVPMAVAFLIQGYGPASIATSTLVMLAWYGAIFCWWRRPRASVPIPGMTTALVYVLVASGGIWVLAAVQATGRGATLAADLAIHAFLSGFAWALVFGAAALTARLGLIEPDLHRRAIRGLAAVAWALFPLGVVGGPEVPVLGWLARAAGLAALYPTWMWIKGLWQGSSGDLYRLSLRAAAVSIGVAVVGLATVVIGGSSLLSLLGRQGVVFYLHALLLGGVSTLLIRHLGDGHGGRLNPSLLAHVAGVGLMLVGIALLTRGSVIGAWISLAGATLTWLAAVLWTRLIWIGSAS